jgi:hypothetical protein
MNLMKAAAAGVGQQRRDGDDRHDRLGSDERHQDERHQRAGAVAGNAAEQRSCERDRRHESELRERDVMEAGEEISQIVSWPARPGHPAEEGSACPSGMRGSSPRTTASANPPSATGAL